jgi:hypothetical protein
MAAASVSTWSTSTKERTRSATASSTISARGRGVTPATRSKIVPVMSVRPSSSAAAVTGCMKILS